MTQVTYLNPLDSSLESSQKTLKSSKTYLTSLKSSQTKMQSHKILRKKPLSLSLVKA